MDKLLRKIADYIEDPEIEEPMELARKILSIMVEEPHNAPKTLIQFLETDYKARRDWHIFSEGFTLSRMQLSQMSGFENEVLVENYKIRCAEQIGRQLLADKFIKAESRISQNSDEIIYKLTFETLKKS